MLGTRTILRLYDFFGNVFLLSFTDILSKHILYMSKPPLSDSNLQKSSSFFVVTRHDTCPLLVQAHLLLHPLNHYIALASMSRHFSSRKLNPSRAVRLTA